MASARFANVLDYLRAVAAPQRSDGQLLQRYVQAADAAAFALLVRRHGPLVHGVCRRIVGPGPDQEDVFQATFLVLSQKAASIQKQTSVAEWLHGVAYRLAMRVKSRRARHWRRERTNETGLEQIVDTAPSPIDPAAQASMRELGAILDQELRQLPNGCRDALVMCLMEGLSHVEAARRLGWPVGTLKGRLQRGRELLRQRLERRGVSVSAVALSVVLAEQAAAVPPTLVKATLACVARQAIPAKVVALAAEAMGTWVGLMAKVASVAAVGLMLAGAAAATMSLASRDVDDHPLPAPKAAAAPQVKGSLAAKDSSGDLLPRSALARLGTTRWRHAAPVHSLAVSPDGKTVVSAADDRYIRVWDFETGKELRRFGPGPGDFGSFLRDYPGGRTLAVVAISRNCELVAATFDRPTIQIWNVATGKELAPVSVAGNFLTGALAFSPDGKQLAIANLFGTIRLWDISAGKVAHELGRIWGAAAVNPLGSHPLAYSPDGKTLVSVKSYFPEENAEVKFWDPQAGRELRRIAVQGGVGTPVFAPDGKLLAFPTAQSEVWLLRTDSGEVLQKWKAPVGNWSSVAFSADSARLFANSYEPKTIVEWDVKTSRELRKFGELDSNLGCMTISADGKFLLVAASHTFCFIDLATGKDRPGPSGMSNSLQVVSFSPDGKSLLTGDGYVISRTYRLWDADTSKERKTFPTPAQSSWMLVSGDGQHVAWRDDKGNIMLAENGDGGWILMTHTATTEFRNHIPTFLFSPDGKTLLVRQSYQSYAVLYDVALGKERCRVEVDQVPEGVRGGLTNSLGFWFSADSKHLGVYFSGRWNKDVEAVVKVHETGSGQLRQRIDLKNEDKLRSAVFSPDGRMVALAHFNGLIQVIELATRKERFVCDVKYAHKPTIPEGNTELGGILLTRWPPGDAFTVAFSPDGRLLAHGGDDGVLRVFDARTGKALAHFEGHTGSIAAIDFAPDGRSIATGSDDTTVLVWDVGGLVGTKR
jgi:RNA polymerase sigma factor (sigma-70 family)